MIFIIIIIVIIIIIIIIVTIIIISRTLLLLLIVLSCIYISIDLPSSILLFSSSSPFFLSFVSENLLTIKIGVASR